jgi:hypothetical protein
MPSCFLVIVSQRTSVNVYDPDIFNCFGQSSKKLLAKSMKEAEGEAPTFKARPERSCATESVRNGYNLG